MKKSYAFLIALSMALLSSCTVVEGIFKAGMWWGIFLVFFVVFIIFWLIARSRK